MVPGAVNLVTPSFKGAVDVQEKSLRKRKENVFGGLLEGSMPPDVFLFQHFLPHRRTIRSFLLLKASMRRLMLETDLTS